MMEGITVLNKVPIHGLPVWVIFIFIMISAAIVGWGIYGLLTDKNKIAIIVIWSIWVICCWFVAWLENEVVTTGKYQYECLIDKSAQFTEIIEHYNIVERRGAIWVLEEKGDK